MMDVVTMLGQMQTDMRTSIDMQLNNMRHQNDKQMEVFQHMVEKMAEKAKEPVETKVKRIDITREKTFTDLPKLSGKPEAFSNWRFKMFEYLSRDESFAAVINWVESKKEVITIEDMNDHEMQDNILQIGDMKWYNYQLWSILAVNCIDEPLG